MEKHFEHNSSAVPQQAEPDIAAMLKRIQQQLVFLEKKIDTLLKQPSGRPFERKPFEKRPFSRPERPFGNYNRYGKGPQGNSLREGNFGPGRRFDKQEGQERRFDKREGQGNQRFGQRNKPFYGQRKERP